MSSNKTYRNQEQNRRLEKLESHIEIINKEMGDIKVSIGEMRADINWLKWWMKLTAGISFGALITSFLNLLVK